MGSSTLCHHLKKWNENNLDNYLMKNEPILSWKMLFPQIRKKNCIKVIQKSYRKDKKFHMFITKIGGSSK